MSRKQASLSDGLIKQNIVLMSGALIAPVIAAATNFEKAAIICMIFSAVTFVTVLICRFIPRKIVYTLRIIIYALVASIVYMPVFAFLNYYYQLQIDWAGVYIPILVANPLILSKTESRFYLRPIRPMIADVIMYILGFDFACMKSGIEQAEFYCSLAEQAVKIKAMVSGIMIMHIASVITLVPYILYLI